MTTEEIFKDAPELLEHPAVKRLISYVSDQHRRSYKFARQYKEFHWRTWDKVMHSEIMLIDGNPAKEVLNAIMDDISESDL